MAVLTIEQSTAKMLYKHVPSWFQRTLEEAFGKENVIESIMDKVKTYQDAVAFADAATLQECSIYPTDTHDIVVYKKLKLIERVLNEGWLPDWNNTEQYKYYPYFAVSGGFDFSLSDCCAASTGTDVGSRLCFHSRDLAVYAGKQFTQLYQYFLTIK